MIHAAPASRPLTSTRQPVRRGGWCILLALSALLLAGCGDKGTEDLQAYVQEVKQRQKSNIPPLPQPKEYEVFAYEAHALRDPFEPPKKALPPSRRTDNGLKPNLQRQRDILEQYSLGSLRMVGSLERKGRRWALISAPDGTIHRVTIGQYMGQDNGQITRITESEVELKEIVPDGLGGWIERRSTLTANQ